MRKIQRTDFLKKCGKFRSPLATLGLVFLMLVGVSINTSATQNLNHGTVNQEGSIRGSVVDKAGGPLPGATVFLKGTTIGTTTDVDGKFTLKGIKEGDIIVFSFVGMQSQEVTIGDQTVLDIILQDEAIGLEGVVVTALGIKREKKALSYSSQTIDNDEISKGGETDFVTSLSGKAAGVQLKQSTAGAGGSTKVLLRGTRNITSTNQPLFVIDGIPMANYQTSDASGFYGGRDSGDGLSSINPDDIESMTVLKGANAAALYGSQGSNGVILITTKSGSKGKTKVTLSSTTTFSKAMILPKRQTSYAESASGSTASWGEAGSYRNYVDDFFDTGLNTMNSIALSGGNNKTTTYFSYANTHANGIMPTNTFNKNNVSFKQSSLFFNDKVKVSSDIMLTQQKVRNKPSNGYYWNPLLGLYTLPNGVDLNDYKENYQTWNADRNMPVQNWYYAGGSEGDMNPYWLLNRNATNERTNRVIASANISWDITSDLQLSGRGSYDYTRQIYDRKAWAGGNAVLVHDNGRYVYSNLESWQAYGDLMLTYNKKIADFDVHGVLGTSYQKRVIGDGVSVDSETNGLTIANVFTLQNVAEASSYSSVRDSRLIKESVFGNISIGWKNRIYLDLSGRNDWASSLSHTDNLSYFYPSAGLTFILSELVSLPRFVDFAKVRTSFARVSNEIPAFRTNPTNSVSVDGLSRNSVQPFNDLKPEMQNNYEGGIEASFFDRRVNLDASYYQIESRDQYLELDAPSNIGYDTYFLNAGHIRNTGVEVALTINPVRSGTGLNWNTTFNYSWNHNKILKLSDDLEGYYTLGGGGEGYNMYVRQGGSLNDIYVNQYARDENGNIILDDDTHAPTRNGNTMKKVGNASPKMMLGWSNDFNYKNWSASFLIDAKIGGKIVYMTGAYLDNLGISRATGNAREAGGVNVSGVLSDGTVITDQTIDAQDYYRAIGGRAGILEAYTYNATNIRLGQVAIGYKLNLASVKFIDDIKLSVVGSNLLFLYKDAPIDPNKTISTGNGTQGVENFSVPSTRSMGFNIKVNF